MKILVYGPMGTVPMVVDDDISQEELGFKAELNKNSIGAIERGESSPTIDTLDQIAHALEITLVDLVDVSKIDL